MTSSTAPNARFLDATQYSVSWFWKRLQSDELDMQPPYQRNPVWQWEQKAFLIDSLINGYPVPEIYIQTSTSPDGDEVHTIVDGQQRIRACVEFLADEFALDESTPDLEGKYFSDLPEEVRSRIYRYKFVVRALPELTEEEVRDIFGRLNRNNVALNRQELRHATYWGGFISAMEKFSGDAFWVKSGLFTTNDFRRMLDIEYVSELVSSGLYGLQNKKSRLDYYYATYESGFPDNEHAQTVLTKVLAQLLAIFEWPNPYRWSRKVDFYTLFVELWQNEGKLPLDGHHLESTRERLIEMSQGVTRVLSLGDPDTEAATEHPALLTYARGVRNSSDLGSRRLRAAGLRSFVWGEDLEPKIESESAPDAHLARLPNITDLLAVEDDDDDPSEVDSL